MCCQTKPKEKLCNGQVKRCSARVPDDLTLVSSSQRVRLAWPSLPVTKHSCVGALDAGLHQGLDAGLIHLILAGCRSERMVKGEESVRAEHHLSRARNHSHAHLVTVEDFSGEKRPDTDRHTDALFRHDSRLSDRVSHQTIICFFES